MARSRRGGGGGGGGGGLFGSRKKAPAPPARPAPRTTAPVQQKSQPPAPQSGGGGMLSGIGSTIAQGMAFGTGSAMAHQAVGAIAGSMSGGNEAAPADHQQTPAQDMAPMQGQQQLQGACADDKVMFYDCLKVNRGDQESCSFLYDQLQTCQRNGNQMTYN